MGYLHAEALSVRAPGRSLSQTAIERGRSIAMRRLAAQKMVNRFVHDAP